MVSMRVLRNKFTEGEKVLCYEPDPAKTKVLYDSKVLDIVARKDENGKKVLEFLIHFQGWNSTWDRFVTEDFVLKDTEENRKLQRELAAKAQLTAGCGNLYRKERKKRGNSASGGAANKTGRDWSSRSSAGGVDSGNGSRGSSGASAEATCGSAVASASNRKNLGVGAEERSDDDGPKIYINFLITPKLRLFLETDNARIKHQNKVVKLPCSPNINEILQLWLTEYIYSRIRLMCHKKGQVKPVPQNKTTNWNIEHILTHANLCHEVADGLRIYVDFMMKALLLYEEERIQYKCYIPAEDITLKIEDEKMDVDEKKSNEKVDKSTEHHAKVGRPPSKHKDKHLKEKQIKDSPGREKTSKDKLPKELLKEKQIKSDESKKDSAMIIEEVASSPKYDHDRRKSLRPRGQTGEILPPNTSTPTSSTSTSSNKAEKSSSRNEQTVVNDKRAALRGKVRALGRDSSLHGSFDITELLGPESNRGSEQLFLKPMTRREKENLKNIAERKLFPEAYKPFLKPTTVYGGIHLARVFMKIPELLAAAEYGEAKVTLLSEFLKHFMQFLEDHPEWFAEELYVQNTYTNPEAIPHMWEEQVKKVAPTNKVKSPPPPPSNSKNEKSSNSTSNQMQQSVKNEALS